jgi:enamine deaminase RidA (YjgF/YER057c/UK114 family)
MDTAITRLNPDGLHRTPGYHHVTIVEAGRLAFIAGQCPLNRSGVVVSPGDVAAQVDQVAANALAALSAAGAEARHVVRSVIYVVTDDRAVLASVWQRFTGSVVGAAFSTASTLLGVAQLGFADQLVELDLTAALPR